MIVGSIVLVVGGAILLMVGVIGPVSDPSDWYLFSIMASVLAAFALVVGVRRLPGVALPDDDFDYQSAGLVGRRGRTVEAVTGQERLPRTVGRAGVPDQLAARAVSPAPVGWSVLGSESAAAGPAAAGPAQVGTAEAAPDEPAEQQVTDAEAARVARLETVVFVVDGRPRYHLSNCTRLRGRRPERLPVSEAIELGFTPCAACEPVTRLLANS